MRSIDVLARKEALEDTMINSERRAKPVQVIEPTVGIQTWAVDLISYRSVLAALCLREIRSKYKQAALGVAWALIQPAVQVAIFTLVFRGIAGVKTPVAYPVFALAALIPFNLFQQTLTLGTPSFVAAQSIVTKVYFPRFYTVIASGAPALVNASIGLVILGVLMIWFQVGLSKWLWLAIPTLVATFLLAAGCAAVLSAINARFRDVQHALPLLMTALLYVSPVLYPLESMPQRLRPFAYLNPITGLVDGFRSGVVGMAPHSLGLVLGAVLIAVLVFTLGVWFFERSQSKLIDIL